MIAVGAVVMGKLMTGTGMMRVVLVRTAVVMGASGKMISLWKSVKKKI